MYRNGGVPLGVGIVHGAAAAHNLRLAETQSRRLDAALLRREFELAARMMRHAAQRGLYAVGAPDRTAADLERDLREISEEYQAAWLLRNRPGGLSDSVARLERSRRDYTV